MLIIKNTQAFTILECLTASSLFLIIGASLTYGMFIIAKLDEEAEIAIKYLNKAQQLYWFFNNQIVGNKGIWNLDKQHIQNKELIQNYLVNRLNSTKKVQILTPQEFIEQYNLSCYIKNKIVSKSAIIKIEYATLNLAKLNPSVKFEYRIFYIAQKTVGAMTKRGLYQYYNNYSDEILSDVTDMNVQMSKKQDLNTYIFNFSLQNYSPTEFYKIPNTISFAIRDS